MDMHMAVPALKTNELVDALNAQMRADRPSELVLRRVLGQAGDLRKKAGGDVEVLASAYAVSGIAQMMLGKTSDAEASFANAFRLSPDKTHKVNYAMSLRRHCYMARAFEVAAELAQGARDDIQVLRDACGLAISCLQLDLFVHYRDALVRLNAEPYDNKALKGMFSGNAFDRFQARFNSRVTDPAAAMAIVECAAQVVRSRFGFAMGYGVDLADDGCASLHFCVSASPDDAADCSYVMAEEIVSRFEDPFMDVFTLSCVVGQRGEDGCSAV